MMTAKNTLYDAAIEASEEYLGPAGERFMRRQIDTHLGIKPENLRKKDLAKLIVWIKPTFALLTDNSEEVEAFVRSLASLSGRQLNYSDASNGNRQ